MGLINEQVWNILIKFIRFVDGKKLTDEKVFKIFDNNEEVSLSGFNNNIYS